ncbi:MAG: hypothetical protein VKO39_00800 [Cyanobacteriota bacterium]|nr:hypothetical protein [Cyanobacteriota bacterium]
MRAADDAYICPICGQTNSRNGEGIHRELNVCSSCGSNSRFRATILSLLSVFTQEEDEYDLAQAATDKSIRGIGISDSPVYAELLALKYNYINTFFHCEPHLDIENRFSFIEYQPIDFIVCNDVIEHTMLPPSEVIPILYEALQPGGILILCAPTYKLLHHIEKYPSFDHYEIEQTLKGFRVHFQSRLGVPFVDASPCFHGGPGRVLELRLISDENLVQNLRSVGFEVRRLGDSLLKKYGAWWPERLERRDVKAEAIGKPLICKKN